MGTNHTITLVDSHRVKRRKWLELPLIAAVFAAALATVATGDAVSFGLGPAVFSVYVAAYLVLGPVLLRILGASDTWRFDLEHGRAGATR